MDEIRERRTIVHDSPLPGRPVVGSEVDYVTREDRGLSGGAIAAIIVAILLTAIVITLIIVNSQQSNQENEIALARERERAAAAQRDAAQAQAAQPQPQPQQPPVVVMPQTQPVPVPVPVPTTPSTSSTPSTPTTPSNVSIEVDVNGKFLDDTQLKSYPITVKAENGVVTLTGDIPSEELKQRAEKLALSVKGVRRVINDLTIQG
jgi:type II secretory pathway pseudopilin PulG